jgi:hypothetical protein
VHAQASGEQPHYVVLVQGPPGGAPGGPQHGVATGGAPGYAYAMPAGGGMYYPVANGGGAATMGAPMMYGAPLQPLQAQQPHGPPAVPMWGRVALHGELTGLQARGGE